MLAEKLLKAAKEYYWGDGFTDMSDQEYDALWVEFNNSDETHPLITTKGDASSSLYYIPEEDYP